MTITITAIIEKVYYGLRVEPISVIAGGSLAQFVKRRETATSPRSEAQRQHTREGTTALNSGAAPSVSLQP
eukprot:6198813-Pleurochrysis_carterae.AAC.2